MSQPKYLLLASLLLLAACSPSDLDEEQKETVIRSASVRGTDNAVSTGTTKVTIDAAQNGGGFLLNFDAIAASKPYRAEWRVSTDSTLSNDDPAILTRNCGAGLGDCAGQAASFSCRFTNDVRTICAEGKGSDTTNLSNYFSEKKGLPGDYFLIFQACDGLAKDCKTRVFSTTFR